MDLLLGASTTGSQRLKGRGWYFVKKVPIDTREWVLPKRPQKLKAKKLKLFPLMDPSTHSVKPQY